MKWMFRFSICVVMVGSCFLMLFCGQSRNNAVAAQGREPVTMYRFYTGKDGLLSADVTRKLFIEMSTVRAAEHQALESKVETVGALLLECTVSGTVKPGVLRAVTHLDIGDDDVEQALEFVPQALGVLARA